MATDGYVSAPLDMLLQHELIVHFCKKIASRQLQASSLMKRVP